MMKRVLALILSLVLVFMVSVSWADENRFVDIETGVSFMIPKGWIETPNTDGNESLKAQYSPGDSYGLVTIGFAVLDLYSAMNLSQTGIARRYVDFSYLSDELITAMLGPLDVETDETKQFGDYLYREMTFSMDMSKSGLSFTFKCDIAVTMINGYVLTFQYMALNSYDEYNPLFREVLDSVRVK